MNLASFRLLVAQQTVPSIVSTQRNSKQQFVTFSADNRNISFCTQNELKFQCGDALSQKNRFATCIGVLAPSEGRSRSRPKSIKSLLSYNRTPRKHSRKHSRKSNQNKQRAEKKFQGSMEIRRLVIKIFGQWRGRQTRVASSFESCEGGGVLTLRYMRLPSRAVV